MKITKQAKEAQLQQIFRMLLESKTQEEIAHELNIALKTVQRYTQELDQRYGAAQRQKTDDTLFLECNLFKNRMLTLYKILQDKASQLKTNGS
jgi:predicted transcriptional regulator